MRVLDEIIDALGRTFLDKQLLRHAFHGQFAGARGKNHFDFVVHCGGNCRLKKWRAKLGTVPGVSIDHHNHQLVCHGALLFGCVLAHYDTPMKDITSEADTPFSSNNCEIPPRPPSASTQKRYWPSDTRVCCRNHS